MRFLLGKEPRPSNRSLPSQGVGKQRGHAVNRSDRARHGPLGLRPRGSGSSGITELARQHLGGLLQSALQRLESAPTRAICCPIRYTASLCVHPIDSTADAPGDPCALAAALSSPRLAAGVAVLPLAREQGLPASFQHAPAASILAGLPRRIQRLERYTIVQQTSDRAIEVRGIRTVEHHREVSAVLPMGLVTELLTDQLVEPRPRQGIRHAHADIVWQRGLEQLTRSQNVGQLLIEIAELNKESDANTCSLQPRARLRDLGHLGPLVHGVEHPLTAALRADPCFLTACLTQGDRHALADEIRTRLNRKGYRAAVFMQRMRELVDPVDPKSKNVVRKPDVLGPKSALEIRHLHGDRRRFALQVLVSPDGLGAPGAAKRAAARGCHVQAEVVMSRKPGAAVALDVHQIPGRQLAGMGSRQSFRTGHGLHPALVQERDAAKAVRQRAGRRIRAGVEAREQTLKR